ncbi:MAG: transposase [Nitrososphaerota archaeon]|nr:transposase [Nitrososphaerota archaeon]
MSVLRTSTILLNPTVGDETQLQELAGASSILWNTANYERRKAFFEHTKIQAYSAQCKSLKATDAFKILGTCKAQALLSKLDECWRSFWALMRLKKKGQLPLHVKKVSPPNYWKENGKRVVRCFYVRNDGWSLNDTTISLSKNLKIPYNCGQLWVGKQGRLEVLKDNGSSKWYAYIPVEVQQPLCRTSQKKASLDIGICNLTALYIQGERPIVYSGRAVLSDWIYKTKKIAEKQGKLAKRRYTSKEISTAFRSRQRRLRHAINSMLRSIFEILKSKGVSELFIGDLMHIRDEANYGDKVNQKLHNFWVFNMIAGRIYELGEEYGITVTKVSERDTSKTCCLCNKMHNGRINRGLMVCREAHQSVNADVNGAVNIMKVAVKRPLSVLSTLEGASGSRLMTEPLLLRWNYNEWR